MSGIADTLDNEKKEITAKRLLVQRDRFRRTCLNLILGEENISNSYQLTEGRCDEK